MAMETPLVELISEIDAAFYVIDCIPNMNLDRR
ncbi:MAG: SGNH/GDSL hydrolase family protein [Candidatus Neomarinimicrobiota bacterium]